MARNLWLAAGAAGVAAFMTACSLGPLGGGNPTPSPSPTETTGLNTASCDLNDPHNLQDVSFAGALSSHLGCFQVKCTGAPTFTGVSLDFNAGGLGYTLTLTVGPAYKGQNSVYSTTGKDGATIQILSKSNQGANFKTPTTDSRLGVLSEDTDIVAGSVTANLSNDKGNLVHVFGTWQCSKK